MKANRNNGKQNRKPKNPKPASGNLRLRVHSSIELNLDTVNVRRVDVALLPNNFDIITQFAPSYQRYRVTRA